MGLLIDTDMAQLQLKTRYGSLNVPFAENDLIGSFLHRYGEWAWDEACFSASLIRPGSRVLDLGAYLGTFGLGVMARKRLKFACFVEGNADIAQALNENVTRNANCHVAVVEGIVSGTGLIGKVGKADPDNVGSTSFLPCATGARDVRGAANIVKLADLRTRYGRFDLIKLDIEGMERDVLFANTFWIADHTNLIAECTESRNSFELGAALLSAGLPTYYFAFPAFNPSNYKGSNKPIFPFAYEASLVVAFDRTPILSKRLMKNRCILRRISSIAELRMAMWETPRWGMPAWADLCPQSVALKGREMLSQRFDEFLVAPVE